MRLKCPSCDGVGCAACSDTGFIEVTDCPQRWIGPDVATFVRVADLYAEGIPVVSGGQIDQSANFIECLRYWQNIDAALSMTDAE